MWMANRAGAGEGGGAAEGGGGAAGQARQSGGYGWGHVAARALQGAGRAQVQQQRVWAAGNGKLPCMLGARHSAACSQLALPCKRNPALHDDAAGPACCTMHTRPAASPRPGQARPARVPLGLPACLPACWAASVQRAARLMPDQTHPHLLAHACTLTVHKSPLPP